MDDSTVRFDIAGYRYPGSVPFTEGDLDQSLFRGRADEVDTVLHSILSSELFLLYSKSGLGKTSLINAGVIPRLRDRAFWPVTVRLNDPSTPPVELIEAQITEAASRDWTVEVGRDPAATSADHEERLLQLLSSLEVWRGNELQRPVLVFDQFEELFTLDWTDDDRGGFISEFGEVIRGRRGPAQGAPAIKVVLVIREDSLGELEALAVDVPQIMRNRFRLQGLEPDQGAHAIRDPALLDDPRLGTHPFTYTEEAADAILDFLRTSQHRGTRSVASTIDPSQLQIVCQHVEREILPFKAPARPGGAVIEIDVDDLGGTAGLVTILRGFYVRTLTRFPPARRRAVQHLCETGLISANGRRLSLEEGEITDAYRVQRHVLDELVEMRLLRAEPRVGSVYYELAHDTLVPPILAARSERRALRRRRRSRVVATVFVTALFVGLVLAWVSGSP